ncbi:DUF2793 domain-containing protein [Hyphomicrobium sp.]|uniref:DUF2793 domain-containing protein n=1 Tax=Hyphomicrobium sp. TaxID=82 RepID=UPI003F728270
MDETTLLKLPYILAAQSQKHVTHNEALRALDAVVQLSVLDKDLATPPGSPAAGACYIVGAAPTGVWSGQATHIAAYQDSAWAIYVPLEGWLAWVADENVLYAFDGTSWIPAPGAGGSVNPVAMVGVNATADTTNRLSVASPASLFNHDGAGHQLKINKASAGQTGSVLFQTGFSGRAEFGLAGDDDFQVKVSADGSTWKQAIVTDRSTGVVQFPFTPRREVLTANRNYYVRTDGNDANTGLANTSGGAFLTIQKALDIIGALDISIYSVTLNVGAGAFNLTGSNTLKSPVGSGAVTISGAGAASTTVTATSGSCFYGPNLGGVVFNISNMKLETVTSGECLWAFGTGEIRHSNIEFGACAGNHVRASQGGQVTALTNYAISGGALRHLFSETFSNVTTTSRTATLTGTPAFSSSFAAASFNALMRANAMTFVGSATGARYSVNTGALLYVNGGGANYFPGSVAGSATAPGNYI